jgi:hypothetical protein
MRHPLEALLGGLGEEAPEMTLSQEAQADNLRAAWEHYLTPKPFRPGDLLKARADLSVLEDKTLVFLFVRWLDPAHRLDEAIIEDAITKMFWNKVDCMIMLISKEGSGYFRPMDSDIFEPFEGEAR